MEEMASPVARAYQRMSTTSGTTIEFEDQGPRLLNLAEKLEEENRFKLESNVRPASRLEEITAVFPNRDVACDARAIVPLPDVILGKGAFGIVYKAFRKQDKNKPSDERVYYAIKEIQLPADVEASRRDRHVDDAGQIVRGTPVPYIHMEMLCTKLCAGHPNVVNLLDDFAALNNMRFSFVLEFCELGDLTNAVEKEPHKRFKMTVARRYFKQIAEGLNFIHARQVTHRDMKLSNVLLSRSRQDHSRIICKISDFGLSSIAWVSKDGILKSSAMKGTREYMAPEIASHYATEVLNVPINLREHEHELTPIGSDYSLKARREYVLKQRLIKTGEYHRTFTSIENIREKDERAYDPMAADVWALGVMLFVMVTGSYPFKRMRNGEEIDLMWRGKFVKYACLSAETNEFLKILLNPNPIRRANMRCVLYHDWTKEGRKIQPPFENPLPPPLSRRRMSGSESSLTSPVKMEQRMRTRNQSLPQVTPESRTTARRLSLNPPAVRTRPPSPVAGPSWRF